MRESEQRLESLAFHQVPARLARTILDLADRYGKMTPVGVRIDLRVTHGQLAELVATTRETLTKVAGWLRGEGIVTLERRQIRIHDYQALEDVAEGVRHARPHSPPVRGRVAGHPPRRQRRGRLSSAARTTRVDQASERA